MITTVRTPVRPRDAVKRVDLAVIDVGGQSLRVALVDRSGWRSVARRSITTFRSGARVEHDPDALWCGLRQAIDELAGQGWLPERVALVTQRASLLAWSRREGRALSPVLSWQDSRYPLPPRLDRQRVRQLTGLYPSPYLGAVKYHGLLQQFIRYREDLCLGPLAAWLIRQLTGHDRVDTGNAQRTLLFDPYQRRWSDELSEIFAMPLAYLPPVFDNASRFGELHWGDLSVPLSWVNGDQNAAALAQPLMSGAARLNLGSGGFLLLPAPAPERLQETLLLTTAQGEARYLCEATLHGVATALQWVVEHYPELGVIPTDLPAARDDTGCFLNRVGGLGSPFWSAQTDSEFIGVPSWRAVFESIAFLLRANLEALPAQTVQRLSLSGGVSRVPGMAQLLADVSGLPVILEAESEVTVWGAAVALGLSMPVTGESLIFWPTPQPALAARYQTWRQQLC